MTRNGNNGVLPSVVCFRMTTTFLLLLLSDLVVDNTSGFAPATGSYYGGSCSSSDGDNVSLLKKNVDRQVHPLSVVSKVTPRSSSSELARMMMIPPSSLLPDLDMINNVLPTMDNLGRSVQMNDIPTLVFLTSLGITGLVSTVTTTKKEEDEGTFDRGRTDTPMVAALADGPSDVDSNTPLVVAATAASPAPSNSTFGDLGPLVVLSADGRRSFGFGGIGSKRSGWSNGILQLSVQTQGIATHEGQINGVAKRTISSLVQVWYTAQTMIRRAKFKDAQTVALKVFETSILPILQTGAVKTKEATLAIQTVFMIMVLSTYEAFKNSIQIGSVSIQNASKGITKTLSSSPTFLRTCTKTIQDYSSHRWNVSQQYLASASGTVKAKAKSARSKLATKVKKIRSKVTFPKKKNKKEPSSETEELSKKKERILSKYADKVTKLKERWADSSEKAAEKLARKAQILTKYADRAYRREYREHHPNTENEYLKHIEEEGKIIQVEPTKSSRYSYMKDQLALIKSNYVDTIPKYAVKVSSAIPNPKSKILEWQEQRKEVETLKLAIPEEYPAVKKRMIQLSDEKAERLAMKYSKLESIEEHAYLVLVDLGMVVPTK